MRWIDACCGIGGFRLGFERAGWPPPTLAFDFNPTLADFYRRKFGEKGGEVLCADIFDVSERPGEFGLEQADLVVCGAPCQPFSVVNPRRNTWDWENADPRLYVPFAACELAARLQADFVLENVLGLLDLFGGEWFARFLAFCQNHGFAVGWTCMDCSAFGTPSRRRHLLIFGANLSRLASGPGPVLSAFRGEAGETPALLSGAGRLGPCVPVRLTSTKGPLGFGTRFLCEVRAEDDFRLRGFGQAEMEFLLGFPPGYTEGLAFSVADSALADAFPPPAAEALGRLLKEAWRGALPV